MNIPYRVAPSMKLISWPEDTKTAPYNESLSLSLSLPNDGKAPPNRHQLIAC